LAPRDRRTARRFKMRLPLTLTWLGPMGRGELTGETTEVSSKGIHFHTSKNVKPGTSVEFHMTLPHEITMAGPVRVRCMGRVIRAEAHEEKTAVVVAIDRYEFMRSESAA
jgi:PilZ domain-containing protein